MRSISDSQFIVQSRFQGPVSDKVGLPALQGPDLHVYPSLLQSSPGLVKSLLVMSSHVNIEFRLLVSSLGQACLYQSILVQGSMIQSSHVGASLVLSSIHKVAPSVQVKEPVSDNVGLPALQGSDLSCFYSPAHSSLVRYQSSPILQQLVSVSSLGQVSLVKPSHVIGTLVLLLAQSGLVYVSHVLIGHQSCRGSSSLEHSSLVQATSSLVQ